MRKLSMKGKRGKSESSSDGDSEENGVGVKGQSGDASSEEEAPKIQKKTPRGRKSRADTDKQTEPEEEPEKNEQENGSPTKRRKKEEQKASTSEDKSNDEEYEVLKVVGQRTIKGRRQFLVRWKGYDSDADTWEQEKNLSCPQLIEEYLSELAETSNEKPEKTPKTAKTPKERKETAKTQSKKPRRISCPPKRRITAVTETETEKSKGNSEQSDNDKDVEETKEFEVEKILEVHFDHKNKKRDFLIRWKGFSPAEDTWEPEANLNCPELISKFMDKVENAKKTELKELRTNPAHTKRYTLMSVDSGRRLSRRNINKQRQSTGEDSRTFLYSATYHQCDE